jgi:DNA-binding LacI/PurR family transcriptional regulator
VVDHLLGLGHRRIAVYAHEVDGQEPDTRCYATASYCRDLLEVAGATCHLVYGSQGRQRLLELVREAGVTAYYELNDHTAIFTMMSLFRAGLSVPGDVSLIGRNDTPWASQSDPALSTMSVNAPAVAAATVSAVQDALAGKPGARYSVAPQLVVRESTGHAPSS